jgi:soluble lytic murein transglycosylase-like protein
MHTNVRKGWLPLSVALAHAGRDVARGAMLLGRGTVGLSGIAALMAAALLVTSEQARERVAAALSSVSVAVAESAADEPRAETAARTQRWSDWLSAAPAVEVEPAQENVTRYLSRRYRVAENAVRQIVVEAFRIGRGVGVDPMLILAVTAIESSLNPFAQSPVGAQGLMQILTRVHSDRFALHGGDHAALDPIANLQVGSEILRDLIRRGGSVERGLQLYVGAGNQADDGGYASRVLGEMARIKLAAGGTVREAQSVAWRAGDAAGNAAGPELLPVGGLPRAADAAADRRAI